MKFCTLWPLPPPFTPPHSPWQWPFYSLLLWGWWFYIPHKTEGWLGYKYSYSTPGELNAEIRKIGLVLCQAMNEHRPPLTRSAGELSAKYNHGCHSRGWKDLPWAAHSCSNRTAGLLRCRQVWNTESLPRAGQTWWTHPENLFTYFPEKTEETNLCSMDRWVRSRKLIFECLAGSIEIHTASFT